METKTVDLKPRDHDNQEILDKLAEDGWSIVERDRSDYRRIRVKLEREEPKT